MKLEEQTLEKIKSRIQEKVMNNIGTWIDWLYLLDAASLLKKVRDSHPLVTQITMCLYSHPMNR